MGISKQMQMEEMHRVSVLEYDEDAEFDVIEDDANFEEQCEEAAIEQSIEDDAIKADMKRQDDEIRKAKNNE
jgi:hypothetical protein